VSGLSERAFQLYKITQRSTGVKLAPFKSGGVCQNYPAKTDDALQQVFISGHYFFQKCWRAGGGGQKKIFVQIPVKTWVKPLLLDQHL
jgi:hypothetical protein